MSGIFNELKRRNIFRVAGVYAVVGWVLVQVAGALESGIGLPEWFDGFVIATLAIGFPLAMLLTWAFELTPEGVRRTPDAVADTPEGTPRLTDGAILLGIAAIIGIAVWQQIGRDSGATPGEPAIASDADAGALALPPGWAEEAPSEIDAASIAVLPFADLSPDGDQGYFSDGIAEEILNALARVEQLRVASRTSAFAFKGQDALGLPAIAEQLGVRHVLEGSVRKAGTTVRITAQLIDAQSDSHLWSDTFDRELTAENLFAIQDEIARAIVAQLGSILGETDPGAVALDTATENLDAYEAYLEARDIFYRRSQFNILDMVALYERAVSLDPEFAEAWAGLSAAYSVVPGWNLGSPDAFIPKAREAADRASALDDRLSLPYTVRASIASDLGDPVQAMTLLDAALERDATHSQPRYARGVILLELGFFDDAEDELRKCLELDPAYEICRRFLSFAMLYTGREREAMRLFDVGMLRGQFSWPLTPAGYLASTGNTSALAILLTATDPNDDYAREALFRLLTDPDFSPDELRAEVARRAPDGARAPAEYDPERFDPRHYDDLFWNPYSLYRVRPDLVNGATDAWRRTWLERRGVIDYWRRVEFPPQCRPVGDDDFRCEALDR